MTAAQLRHVGMGESTVRGRVRRHGWESVGRGAYRLLPDRDHTDRVRAAIAVLENAVASHETAAELHRIPLVARGLAVVTVHSRTTHRFPGVRVKRCHDLDLDQVTMVDAIRATSVARTVFDLAAGRSIRHIGHIVDTLVSDRRLDLAELSRVTTAVGRRGRAGTTVMREVLSRRIGDAHDQSELERRARALMSSAGLPQPRSEYPIPWAPHRRFDDAYPEHHLALEWDSRRYHGQLAAFDADRRRDRDAVVHGWRLLRFTWSDVVDRPATVIDAIRSVLVV